MKAIALLTSSFFFTIQLSGIFLNKIAMVKQNYHSQIKQNYLSIN